MKDAKRYLAAEQKLFAHAGISPVERTITLARIGGLARVLDIGQGEPVLFFAGGPNVAASFALLVAELPGFRCLLVDRPGTGLSAPPPVVPNAQRLPGYLVDLVADVLDGLLLERAHVIASSLGGSAAIRAAVALPQRVDRVVLLGCPPFVLGWKQPSFFTLLRTPVLGKLLLRLPVRRSDALRFLREMGSKQSLSGGRIPDFIVDFSVAWMADTYTMRNDAAMIKACGTRADGFDRSLDLHAADLSRVVAPTLAIAGTEDPVGGVDVVESVVSMMPNARVTVLEGAGHLPWLDDPIAVGRTVKQFMSEGVAQSWNRRPERNSG